MIFSRRGRAHAALPDTLVARVDFPSSEGTCRDVRLQLKIAL
jgi:hypothetical protein